MQSKMNPDVYFEQFVLGNFTDFQNDESNIRKSLNVAVTLNHMTDNYYNYWKKTNSEKVKNFSNINEFKKKLSQKSRYFSDVQSIANVYKHLYHENPHLSHVTVLSGGAVCVITNETSNENISLDDEWIVYYTKKDGKKIKIKEAFDDVFNMWYRILKNDKNDL